MNSTDLTKKLIKSGIKAFDVGVKGMISLYDDDWYSNSDYDILGSDERKFIRAHLLEDGWSTKGSRYFYKDDFSCAFPKPSHTLGGNPANKVFDELGDDKFVFVTPTQALLVLAAIDEWDQEKIKHLVNEQPANLDKVWQWVKEEFLESVEFKQIHELKELQLKNFAKKIS